MVCTETYKRRFEGKHEEKIGLGAIWESKIITQELYDAAGENPKFIPVVFSPEDAHHIPVVLRGQTHYDLSDLKAYDKLFRRLTKQPARTVSPVASQIRRMPILEDQLHIQPLSPLERQSHFRELPSKSPSYTGSLMVNIFDGTRRLMGPGVQTLLRVHDGNQKGVREILNQFYNSPSILVEGLPFYDNFADNYTVLVSADRYMQAGLSPIRISPNTVQSVDLMLLPREGSFNFHGALWPTLRQKYPAFAALLAHGAADNDAAQDRYSQLMENQPASLASSTW